jgi:hypothetical protein
MAVNLSLNLEIRHALERSINAMGGKVGGGGTLMVHPYTMDFDFEYEGERYSVNLTQLTNNEAPDEIEDGVYVEGEELGEEETGICE